MKKHDSLLASFRHAFNGIFACIRRERSIKIQLTVTALVIVAGIVFRISMGEWLVCLLLFGMVIGAELFNTAIEAAVDFTSQKEDPNAMLAKDAAAGAVLFSALIAVVAGILIFLPKFVAFFSR